MVRRGDPRHPPGVILRDPVHGLISFEGPAESIISRLLDTRELVDAGLGAAALVPLGGVDATGNRHVSHYISYRPDGSAHLKSNAFQVGTLTICPSTGEEGRQLVISIGGRIRRAESRCGE